MLIRNLKNENEFAVLLFTPPEKFIDGMRQAAQTGIQKIPLSFNCILNLELRAHFERMACMNPDHRPSLQTSYAFFSKKLDIHLKTYALFSELKTIFSQDQNKIENNPNNLSDAHISKKRQKQGVFQTCKNAQTTYLRGFRRNAKRCVHRIALITRTNDWWQPG